MEGTGEGERREGEWGREGEGDNCSTVRVLPGSHIGYALPMIITNDV